MRSLVAIAIGLGTPLAIAAFIACGPPSSFDNITGAPAADGGPDDASPPLVEDKQLAPPRRVAPLSQSYVNGLRPTLRWALTPPATGARITLCGDPRCEGPRKEELEATGTELTVPKDLAPGLWFWRLASTTDQSFGPAQETMSSFLLRGGAAGGAPAGSFLDMNGDGNVDLLLIAIYTDPEGVFHIPVLARGTNPDDPTALLVDEAELGYFFEASANASLEATDVNGDGRSDAIIGAEDTRATPPFTYLDIVAGSANQTGVSQVRLAPPGLPPYDAIPSMHALGDIDGDGYGDLIVGTKRSVVAAYGAADGFGPLAFIDQLSATPPPDSGFFPAPSVPIAVGGHDVDEQGRAGFAVASYYGGPPFYTLRAEEQRYLDGPYLDTGDAAALTPATAFTSGDLDGDGKADLVFATIADGKPSVCVFDGAEPRLKPSVPCWSPETAPEGFATSLAIADLDGDGKDEVLVSATSGGVFVLSAPAPGQLAGEPLAIDHGARITVLYPGRPKPAVWAATRADGASVGVYRGKERVRVLEAAAVFPSDPGAKFGVPIR
ncbi:MAG: VCBS repeat-containing protein [Labilithrix sp.]|nr:VCBS repeat-containing protein [Labilithrix sp.]MCW5810785.1 VCBS repeat-containing protein [Labilithrix sp.]